MTHPALMLVRHKHHAAFVLYGVREDLAASFDCANRNKVGNLYSLPDWKGVNAQCRPRLEGIRTSPPDGHTSNYGRFYVSGMHIETVAGETVALLLGWVKKDGAWKIYTYRAPSRR